MSKFVDLAGQRFGRLLVIERSTPVGVKHIKYKCLCDCGNYCEVCADNLRYGVTKSCGCIRKETVSKMSKSKGRKITYSHVEDYIVGDDGNGHQFKISEESYSEISKYQWTYTEGYWSRSINMGNGVFKQERMHRFLMSDIPTSILIDHENTDKSDNRLSNLRVADYSTNGANTGLRKNNTSGITGVRYNKKASKWYASITVQGKTYWLGESDNKEDVIKARLLAEKKYFKEFAPQKHLYKQYGIEDDE